MAREIKKVAVVGAGIMGSGIAAHLANAGVPSLLLDIVPPNLTEDEKKIKAKRNQFAAGAVQGLVKQKGQIQPLMNKRRASMIEVGNIEDDLDRLAECDWIIEVVLERLDIKRSLFDKIIKVIKPGTIVTSNTSGISIQSMTEGYPEDFQKHFMVTHFFNPVRYMRLLELVSGEKTDPAVVKLLADFGETKLGKGIVYGYDTPNFVANRIGVAAMAGTVQAMIEDDFTIEEVDAVTGKPMAQKMGSYKTADLVGLDTIGHILTNTYAALPNDEARDLYVIPDFLQHLLDNKALGNKTKGGYYKKVGKEKMVLDRKTKEYVPVTKIKADSLKAAKNTDESGARVKGLVNANDKYGKFAWKLFSRLAVYSANRVGEICDDVINIDNGMKWGYAWELGPFEQWDAIGVRESVERMRGDGLTIPKVVETMVEKSDGTWYKVEGGVKYFWDIKSESYKPVPTKKQWINLQLKKNFKAPLKKNSDASLVDLGDGVACIEFHCKMNAIGDDIINMIHEGIDLVESSPDWAGLVITNEGDNFSVGANLAMIMMGAMAQQFDMIEKAVDGLHKGTMRMRYCSKPVVTAPFGMALGGGCEMILAADAVVSHSELYAGLVELGAGLIPGGAGNKNLLIHYLEGIPADMSIDRFPIVQRVFEQIAMAKVSLSAFEARDMRILRHSDRIVMNRDELTWEAKSLVKGMYEGGYKAPERPDYLILPGMPGVATFKTGLYNMKMGGYVTEFEEKIASKLAYVLCGGDIQPNSAVTEERLLELEKEAFMSLVGEPKALERMQSLLTSGKPLRN
jgi:3-hydroxyacyl-CoA dehydrogenase